MTNDLKRRIYEHKLHLNSGFTSKYGCDRLVYFETHESIESAISREKELKGLSREKKITLIIKANSEWKDLYAEL